MSPDYAQRRRIAVAAAITVIAVPAVLLLDRGGESDGQVVPTVVSSVAEGDATAPSAGRDPADDTDPMGTTGAAFLEQSDTQQVRDPATIAIPRLPDAVEGRATFSRSITDVASCQVNPSVGAPFRAAITVTNLDNSRSVQCINNIGGPEPDAEVVLHADAFLQIGDLTDAPVPVQLTW